MNDNNNHHHGHHDHHHHHRPLCLAQFIFSKLLFDKILKTR